MHVVVNAAMSADGKLSSRRREQIAISTPEDFDRVDRLRADADAVLVGIGTVLADDPSLTVDDPARIETRTEAGRSPHPARVIADSRARTPPDARVLDDEAETYVLASRAAPDERVATLEDSGAIVVRAGRKQVDLAAAFADLEAAGIDRVLAEGGGELIFSLFRDNLVDELTVFVGSTIIGGRDAPTLADGDGFVEDFPQLSLEEVRRLDSGVLLGWTVPE